MGMIIKNGSIYQLTKIEGNSATVFSKHGRFIVKLILVRLLNISEDSKLVVTINGNESEYVFSDLLAMFVNEISYVPFTIYYYAPGSSPDGNEFVFGFKTDWFVDSLNISVNIKSSSNPMYSVESILYERLTMRYHTRGVDTQDMDIDVNIQDLNYKPYNIKEV